MASPQTSKGYARLANELAQAVYRFPFSGQELRVVVWTIRHSFGWNRRDTPRTSVRALAQDMKMPTATAAWVLRGLTDRGILLRMSVSGGIRLNKNYDEWLQRRAQQLPLMANTTAKSAGKSDAPARARPGAKPAPARANARKEFEAPTIADVKAYCLERKSKVDPEKFWHHYEANGWRSGRHQTPVTNWKSLVCYWERTNYEATNAAASGPKCPLCDGPQPYPNAIVCHTCGARCRACGTETALLRIIKRPDGTRTAQCAKGCPRAPAPTAALARGALPKATTNLEEQKKHERFMADHRRRMAARERKA